MKFRLGTISTALSLCAISWPGTSLGACTAIGSLKQICGLQSPEDMELLPDGKHILISEMVGNKNQPGKFAVLDVVSGELVNVALQRPVHADWGDIGCKQRSREQLSPHGIHLSRLSDGRLLLLAINHGDTESVHAYDVIDEGGKVRLAWRGCVNTTYNFNDLAATPDGFIASYQFDKRLKSNPDVEKILFGGRNTGFAVRWSRASGFRKIPGTSAPFPNGMTVSSDGTTAWMAATAAREVRKIDLTHNRQVESAKLPLAPDNLSWTADGQLLVTGAEDIHRLVKCVRTTPSCRVPFAVARIDPDTLKSQVIFRHDGSLLLGASVAIVAQGNIYIGSFAGEHILRAPAP